jgi:hypothetical protein
VQSCSTKQYVQNEETQVVNTAWAVLTLLKAQWPDRRPVDRAVQVLMKRQLPNGNWPQEDIKGVFNANCAISYTAYKNIFPIWALGTLQLQSPLTLLNPPPTKTLNLFAALQACMSTPNPSHRRLPSSKVLLPQERVVLFNVSWHYNGLLFLLYCLGEGSTKCSHCGLLVIHP